MIWSILCGLGFHDWRPVFRHKVAADGTTRSLMRCYRVRLSGTLCLAERYIDTSLQTRRGGQL